MTTEQIRIRLTDDETKELKDLAARCDLQPTTLAAVFCRAAMRAIWVNGGKVTLPLNFAVLEGEQVYQLNEKANRRKVNSSQGDATKTGSRDDILDIVEKHHPSKPSRPK